MKSLKKNIFRLELAVFSFIMFFAGKMEAAKLPPLVSCDGIITPCNFNQIIILINRVIEFIILMILPISAIMFAYAGFILMTKGSNPGDREKAKKIFLNVAIGIILILGAWLIVATVLKSLGVPADYYWLDLAGLK